MIESILHFLGLCPDNLSHPNLLMFLAGFGVILSKIKRIYYIIKNKISH